MKNQSTRHFEIHLDTYSGSRQWWFTVHNDVGGCSRSVRDTMRGALSEAKRCIPVGTRVRIERLHDDETKKVWHEVIA